MALKQLNFVKTLVTFGIIYVTDPLLQIWIRLFASVDSPSIFLTIILCRPCSIIWDNFTKSVQFTTRFISETKTVTPNFFCISGTGNSLSAGSKNIKKFYRQENFRVNVLNTSPIVDPTLRVREVVPALNRVPTRAKSQAFYPDVSSEAPFTRVRKNFCTDEFCSWTACLHGIRENSIAVVFTRVRAKFRPVAVFDSRP